MFIDPELFGVAPWISGQPPEDTLKRWKSACNIVNNRRRKFRMVANLANQAETRVNTFKIQNKAYKEFYDDDPSSEYLAKAGIFQEFYDDIEYACKGRYVELLKRKKAVVFPWEESSLSYPVLKATSYGVYILCHLVFKAFSSVRNIFSNLLLGVEFVRHKFQYYMSLCNYIVTEAAKVRRRQDCPNNVEYVSYHDDDDSKGHPISEIMEPGNNVSPNGKFRRRITSWQKGELLGSGSYGFVYEGLTDDGFFFAVKEVSLQDEGPRGKQSILQLEQEISLLGQFEHDNIVQYLGTDRDEKRLCIFLELVTKGSLASLYQKYHLSDSQVSSYTRQILNGLKYLHEQNVVHRDIKCANILVDASGSVKLADFGLAKATTMNDVKSCKGTAFWMAPEVVNLKKDGYGLTADIWSLGCTVLEMLTRRHPYSHLEGGQAMFKIGGGELPPVPNSLSRDAQDFILKCLQVNPNDRPTAAELMEHPFVKRPQQTSRCGQSSC